MRSFRSNQRGRVQPAEYAGEVTKPQQRYGSRHRPRSAGASSRRYGSSRWPKPQYPTYHQYANVPAGRPSSAHYQQRPRTAGSRPSSGNTANVDAWLRADMALHMAAAATGLRPVVGVWATASFCFGGGSSSEKGGTTGILPFLGAAEGRRAPTVLGLFFKTGP